MRTAAGLLMIANAALFLFGAAQHAGIAVGLFHEPRIIPAAIVEAICAVSLVVGAVALFREIRTPWHSALIGNFVALSGVLLGIIALAVGAGPRTASNDLYHRIMLALIAAAVVVLLLDRRRMQTVKKGSAEGHGNLNRNKFS